MLKPKPKPITKAAPLPAFAVFLIVFGLVSEVMGFGYVLPLVISGIAILIFCAGVAVGSWGTDVDVS